MFRKNSLSNIGFIAALAIIILMLLVGNSQGQTELGPCMGVLEADVKMYQGFGTAFPLWYEPTQDSLVVTISGKMKNGDEDFYRVRTGRYLFWTPSLEYMTECDEYEVTEYEEIRGWGCASAYDPQAVHQIELMPQDGRYLGFNGTGWTLTDGWGFVTFVEGEWRLTPKLENIEGNPLVEVIHTSFHEACLKDLPKR